MSTIPANLLVNINPSVLASGGASLDVIGLMLTTNPVAPLGQVLSFPTPDAVAAYFGATSAEAIAAEGGDGMGAGYFGAFTNKQKVPAAMLVAQYNASAVAAYLRGGDVSALTLAELQAISGSLSIVMDGYTRNAASINLAGATSFSSAATLIQAGLNAAISTVLTGTGSISGTTLTVTAKGTGIIAAGQTVGGTAVTAGTIILSQISGSIGGTGTYLVNTSQTALSAAITFAGTPVVVSYSTVNGAFTIASGVTGAASSAAYATGTIADDLLLRAVDGAVLSQGAAAASPAAFMNALKIVNSNWVTFWNLTDPDAGSGNSIKEAFADWVDTQNNRFAYICWDTDVTPTTTLPATTSLGYLLSASENSGTCLIYEPSDLNQAAFVAGCGAAIDFTQKNGRITFAYKSQAGLVAGVSDPTVATNLGGNPQTSSRGNGYNYYGAFANASAQFTFFQRGFVTGAFQWLDSFINQVWMNSAFQLALLNLLATARSVPYSVAGNAMIENALADAIAAALNFGAFGPGPLTGTQIALVNSQAGQNIADTLQTQGYYLQIVAATPTIRAARTSPSITFWYIDNGAVQAINMNSVALT